MSYHLQQFSNQMNGGPLGRFCQIAPVAPTRHHLFRIRGVPQRLLLIVLMLNRIVLWHLAIGYCCLFLWNWFGMLAFPVAPPVSFALLILLGGINGIVGVPISLFYFYALPINHRKSILQIRRAVVHQPLDYDYIRYLLGLRTSEYEPPRPRISTEETTTFGFPPRTYRVRILITVKHPHRVVVIVRPRNYYLFGNPKDCAKVADMELVELLMLLKSARY